MQKESLAQKSVYWLKVISLGLILGLGIQFAQAWTSPILPPPNSTISGPITTSATAQTKNGPLTVNGVVESNGGGATNRGAFKIGNTGTLQSWSGWNTLTDGAGSFWNSAFEAGYIQADTRLLVYPDIGMRSSGGWLYIGDRAGNDYNGRGVAADKIWGNTVIQTPKLCLNSLNNDANCITSWPSGGGGGGIASISGGSCGVGQVVQSISSTGVATCGNAGGAVVAAWVSFDGTNGSIRSSYNVSSVQRNVVGLGCVGGSAPPCGYQRYTINFTQPMGNSNYATVVTTTNNAYSGNQTVGLIPVSMGQAQTNGSVNLLAYLGNNTGSMYPGTFPNVSVVIYSN